MVFSLYAWMDGYETYYRQPVQSNGYSVSLHQRLLLYKPLKKQPQTFPALLPNRAYFHKTNGLYEALQLLLLHNPYKKVLHNQTYREVLVQKIRLQY